MKNAPRKNYKEELFDEVVKIYEILRQHVTTTEENAILNEKRSIIKDSEHEFESERRRLFDKRKDNLYFLHRNDIPKHNEGLQMILKASPSAKQTTLNNRYKYFSTSNNSKKHRMYPKGLRKRNWKAKFHNKGSRRSQKLMRNLKQHAILKSFRKHNKKHISPQIFHSTNASFGSTTPKNFSSLQELNLLGQSVIGSSTYIISSLYENQLQTTESIQGNESHINSSHILSLQERGISRNLTNDSSSMPTLTQGIKSIVVSTSEEANNSLSSINMLKALKELVKNMELVSDEKVLLNGSIGDLLQTGNKIERREKHELFHENDDSINNYYSPQFEETSYFKSPSFIAVIFGLSTLIILILLAVGVYFAGKNRIAQIKSKNNKSPNQAERGRFPAKSRDLVFNKRHRYSKNSPNGNSSSVNEFESNNKHDLVILETIDEENNYKRDYVNNRNNFSAFVENDSYHFAVPRRKPLANPGEKLKKLHENIKKKQKKTINFNQNPVQKSKFNEQAKHSRSMIPKRSRLSKIHHTNTCSDADSPPEVAELKNLKDTSARRLKQMTLSTEDLREIICDISVSPAASPCNQESNFCVNKLLSLKDSKSLISNSISKSSKNKESSNTRNSVEKRNLRDIYPDTFNANNSVNLTSVYKQEGDNLPESLFTCLGSFSETT